MNAVIGRYTIHVNGMSHQSTRALRIHIYDINNLIDFILLDFITLPLLLLLSGAYGACQITNILFFFFVQYGVVRKHCFCFDTLIYV